MNLIVYFTDPVFRAPTIGSMLMCFSAALVGVIVFLRKESLVGESLSHATYPGVIGGILLSSSFFGEGPLSLSFGILGGAFSTALIGLGVIVFLERKMKVAQDAALCFILSAFFGVGLTIASRIQFTHSALYRQVQVYLYGQAATMTDIHILIYGSLALVLISLISLLYKELQVITLDRNYAKSLGVKVRMIDLFVFVLMTLAIIIGIRSVGVVLMSSMLIAPPSAARQFSHHLSKIFIISGIIGLVSGFFGNVLSIELTNAFDLTFPTGPMIVLTASIICMAALFFAPDRGLFPRYFRVLKFRDRCLKENLLKEIWRAGHEKSLSFDETVRYQSAGRLHLFWVLKRLIRAGWVEREQNRYRLTEDGYHRASRIVRLHRLWEVYLAKCLDVGAERVHRNAEEMEHVITPELEKELTLLLDDPREDPHHQPIPKEEDYDV